MKKLLILGAGQYGMVTKETAEAMNCFQRIDFLDDKHPAAIGKLEDYASFREQYTHAVVAMGNPVLRLQWLDKLAEAGFSLPVLIHPRAYVAPSATLGEGSIVEPMAVVNTAARVGKGCLICAGCVINHNSCVGDGCQIDCNSVVPGSGQVPSGTKVHCASVFHNE